MLYNYRFDRGRKDEILERIRGERVLSQGWGGGTNADLSLRDSDFRDKTKEFYGLKTTRIPTNLTRIRDFQDGDILVTPHLPRYGKVSIHIVNGGYPDCYEYVSADSTHQNHRIRLSESYGLRGAISAGNGRLIKWKAKLPWMRLPVLSRPDFESTFRELIAELRDDPSIVFERSELDTFFESLHQRVVDQVWKELEDIAPSGGPVSFERVCERLLRAAGYTTQARNHYDRDGGDADLYCVRDRDDVSPFESGESHLLVQVKKHSGATDQKAVKQVLKMADDAQADACVMTLAEGFTPEAESLAASEAVVLLTGSEICSLLLEEIAHSRPGS